MINNPRSEFRAGMTLSGNDALPTAKLAGKHKVRLERGIHSVSARIEGSR
jgi:hypothetical protein